PSGAAAAVGAADGGAALTVSVSSTRATPSVVLASSSASARSVSSPTSPFNATTPPLAVTLMWRPLSRSSRKYLDWMLDVIRASSGPDPVTGWDVLSAVVPVVATA